MADDTFNDKNQITTAKHDELKALGYTGENTIESMLLVLNKEMEKLGKSKTNGKSWWIDFKNKAEAKGISFIDAIFAEVKTTLAK